MTDRAPIPPDPRLTKPRRHQPDPMEIIASVDVRVGEPHAESDRKTQSVRASIFRHGATMLVLEGASMQAHIHLSEADAEAYAHAVLNAINNARAIRALENGADTDPRVTMTPTPTSPETSVQPSGDLG